MPRQKNDELFLQQDSWIKHFISSFSSDALKMQLLFTAISELAIERRFEYIKFFLNYNQDFEDFRKIPIIPTSYSWTNSAIPLYSLWINLLEQLLPFLNGMKFIKHKKLVEDYLSGIQKSIEDEEIRSILER
jgi:hypothetical protein